MPSMAAKREGNRLRGGAAGPWQLVQGLAALLCLPLALAQETDGAGSAAAALDAERSSTVDWLAEANRNPQSIANAEFAVDLADEAAVELARGLLADPRLAPHVALAIWTRSPQAPLPHAADANAAGQRPTAFGRILRREPSLAAAQGRGLAEAPAAQRAAALGELGAATLSLVEGESEAAWIASERCLLRLAQLDQPAAILAAHAALRDGGADAGQASWLALRALRLAPSGDAASWKALHAEARLAVASAQGIEGAERRSRLAYLGAVVGSAAEARRALDAAEAELRSCWRALQGRAGAGAALGRSALHQRLASVALARLSLALEERGADFALDAELARLAAACCLEQALAQREAALAGESRHASLDSTLDDPEGWLYLRHDAGARGAAPLAARLALARALAPCAPLELPGLAALAPAAIEDDARAVLDEARAARRAVLRATLEAHVADLERGAGWQALQVEERERRALEPAAEERAALSRASWRHEELVAGAAALERGDESVLSELRTPSWILLEAARAAREEGSYELARALLDGLRADLDADPRSRQWLWGIEFLAAVESSLGSTLSDQGDPRRAQAELETSLARLEELEALLERRGDAPAVLRALRNQQSSVLVSLAVNANVKQRDPQAALAWFERAWALRKDETMRVLAACYRARAGRAAEARELLSGVASTSAVHYNLACAWALLGEHERALEELRRELDDPRAAPGAIARRKEWARADPDLASLRDDPRFSTLLR
ncbi:MAG: hypothetical protein RL112_508 [Planctomycetota bacterium]